MKDKNYKILTENISRLDENEKFLIVNKRINEIILNSENPKETLQALICLFEAKNNINESFAGIAIAYALLVGGVSLLAQVEGMLIFTGFLLLISSLIVARMSHNIRKRELERGFVLQALRFRYESLPRETICSHETEYIVKVARK